MALTVSLLGGESTGKTTLAHGLLKALLGNGVSTTVVPEHLRRWCANKGRAPNADEQEAIALEQARLSDLASDEGQWRVVIADTAPLVVAAYSELYFNDRSLFPVAVQHQRGCDLNLLMGLDLPWVADGLFRDGPGIRDATDTILRRELQGASLPYQTIYGHGEARVQQALRAVGLALGLPLALPAAEWGAGRYSWNCDRCSHPDCEQRIFSGLI